MYSPTSDNIWNGRIDEHDSIAGWRWHQKVHRIDLQKELRTVDQGVALLGFCSDAGVLRNKGRIGAAKGPDIIRKALSNLAWHFSSSLQFIDAGNVYCIGQALEDAQEEVGGYVTKLLNAGFFPIVLGGGHEVAYGHYLGIYNHLKNHQFSILNFDAHFDLRFPHEGSTSGTSFHQIATWRQQENTPFHYTCIGVNEFANTDILYQNAKQFGASWITRNQLNLNPFEKTKSYIDEALLGTPKTYISICLDVFPATIAPGVSAPNPMGVNPDLLIELLNHSMKSKKIVSFDIAEYNPEFDRDGQTARLAAAIIFEMLQTRF